jgi:hypothetical protein
MREMVDRVTAKIGDARNALFRARDMVASDLADLETALPPATSDDARDELARIKDRVDSDLGDLETALQEAEDAVGDVEYELVEE